MHPFLAFSRSKIRKRSPSRRAVRAAVIFAMLVAGGAQAAEADALEIRLINRASLPIVSVLFSQAGGNDSDGDVFANRTVAPGGSLVLNIPRGRTICMFDLRAEFDEDDERDPVERAAGFVQEWSGDRSRAWNGVQAGEQGLPPQRRRA